jgi:hypothetical protein
MLATLSKTSAHLDAGAQEKRCSAAANKLAVDALLPACCWARVRHGALICGAAPVAGVLRKTQKCVGEAQAAVESRSRAHVKCLQALLPA